MKNVDPTATTAAEPTVANVGNDVNSQRPAKKPSANSAPPRECDVLAKLLLNVREVAFLLRVGVRTVWRMAADPKSGFPTPRRLRGRTLFVRDEVLAFLAKGEPR